MTKRSKSSEFENFDAAMQKIIKAPHVPITKKKKPSKKRASVRASSGKD